MNLIPSSDGTSLATAMAVSGTLILFAIGFQKSYSTTRVIVDHIAEFSDPDIPSCTISNSTRKKGINRGKARKKVRFEEDIEDPDCRNEQFKTHRDGNDDSDDKNNHRYPASSTKDKSSSQFGGLPANRAALYEAILRDRVRHRLNSCY